MTLQTFALWVMLVSAGVLMLMLLPYVITCHASCNGVRRKRGRKLASGQKIRTLNVKYGGKLNSRHGYSNQQAHGPAPFAGRSQLTTYMPHWLY